jgi:hypothetical protein
MAPSHDPEKVEDTIFWVEREVTRLRVGEPAVAEPDISGDEMAAIMERRRREIASRPDAYYPGRS